MRYEYPGYYTTRAEAEFALDDCYASGDIREIECPDIEVRHVLHDDRRVTRYVITLQLPF